MPRPALALFLAVTGGGCATAPVREPPPVASSPAPEATAGPDSRLQAVALARRLVGRRTVSWPGQTFPDDCSGLVLGIYASVGMPLGRLSEPGDNAVTALYRFALAHGRVFTAGAPAPGDLVFFHDTYDQNGDGLVDDGLTHVALVEAVEEDGTVLIIHRVRRGVMRYRMNLRRPELRTDPRTGRPLNDYLRGSSGTGRPVLTAQLFAAYGAVLPAAHPATEPSPLPVLAPQPAGGSI